MKTKEVLPIAAVDKRLSSQAEKMRELNSRRDIASVLVVPKFSLRFETLSLCRPFANLITPFQQGSFELELKLNSILIYHLE